MSGLRSVQVYDPIVEWASKALQTEITISDSIFGSEQPEEAIEAVRCYLEGLGTRAPPCNCHYAIPATTCWNLTAASVQASLHGSSRQQRDSLGRADPFLWVWQYLRFV